MKALIKTAGDTIEDIYGSPFPSYLFKNTFFKVLFINDEYVTINFYGCSLKFHIDEVATACK